MKYVLDTNVVTGSPGELIRVMGPVLSVPLIVVQELVHQLGDDAKEPMARRGLVKLAMTDEAVIGEHPYNVIRRALGESTRAHPAERQHWWRVVQRAALGASWEELKLEWDESFALGDTAFEASIFQTMKEQGAEFKRMYLDMAKRLGEENKAIAVRQRKTKEDVGRDEARSYMDTLERKAAALLEVSLYCQLAAMARHPEAVDVLGAIEDVEFSVGIEALGSLFERIMTRDFALRTKFAVSMALQSQVMYMRGDGAPDGNDYFDLLVMIGVDEEAGDVFASTERRWKKAARLSGMDHLVWDIESLKARFLL